MREIAIRVKHVVKELIGIYQRPMKQKLNLKYISPQSFEEQIYCSVVFKDDICYDIGANIGEVSLLLARLTGEHGYVFAFEPVWPTYIKLCKKVQEPADSRALIITVPLGFAGDEKVATIQVPSGDFGMGSLAQAEDWSRVLPGSEIMSYKCQFATLDGFIQSSKLPAPDFIKIDVEGAELLVLQGAHKFFEDGHRPIMLIELFAPWESAFNYGPWEVLSLLTALGYSFLFACPNGLIEYTPSESQPFPMEYAQGYNILAFCPNKHEQRINNLDGLRVGGGESILSMPPPPFANTFPNRPLNNS